MFEQAKIDLISEVLKLLYSSTYQKAFNSDVDNSQIISIIAFLNDYANGKYKLYTKRYGNNTLKIFKYYSDFIISYINEYNIENDHIKVVIRSVVIDRSELSIYVSDDIYYSRENIFDGKDEIVRDMNVSFYSIEDDILKVSTNYYRGNTVGSDIDNVIRSNQLSSIKQMKRDYRK